MLLHLFLLLYQRRRLSNCLVTSTRYIIVCRSCLLRCAGLGMLQCCTRRQVYEYVVPGLARYLSGRTSQYNIMLMLSFKALLALSGCHVFYDTTRSRRLAALLEAWPSFEKKSVFCPTRRWTARVGSCAMSKARVTHSTHSSLLLLVVYLLVCYITTVVSGDCMMTYLSSVTRCLITESRKK